MTNPESKGHMPHPDDVMLCTCGDPEYKGCYRHGTPHPTASSSPDEIPEEVLDAIATARYAERHFAVDKAEAPNSALRWLADAYERVVRERDEAVQALSEAERIAQTIHDGGGCGDHSCLFVPAQGVGTNGGCRCHYSGIKVGRLALLYRAIRARSNQEASNG